jgi:hypothetical protein
VRVEEEERERESHWEIRVWLKEVKRVGSGFSGFLWGIWMLGGGGGIVVAISGAFTCCSYSGIGGKSRIMLSAVFRRTELGSSSSSAVGLSVLTASA